MRLAYFQCCNLYTPNLPVEYNRMNNSVCAQSMNANIKFNEPMSMLISAIAFHSKLRHFSRWTLNLWMSYAKTYWQNSRSEIKVNQNVTYEYQHRNQFLSDEFILRPSNTAFGWSAIHSRKRLASHHYHLESIVAADLLFRRNRLFAQYFLCGDGMDWIMDEYSKRVGIYSSEDNAC